MSDTSHQTVKADTPVTPPTKAELIRLKYSEGGSDVEVAAILGLTLNKFHELCNELPELNTIVEMGRTIAEAWWMEVGRKNIYNKDFQGSLYNFQMKNRYNWADKVDTGDKSSTEPVNVDAARAELSKALAKLSKKHPELLSGANLNQKIERT